MDDNKPTISNKPTILDIQPKKYVDLVGLANFWQRVKAYIDTKHTEINTALDALKINGKIIQKQKNSNIRYWDISGDDIPLGSVVHISVGGSSEQVYLGSSVNESVLVNIGALANNKINGESIVSIGTHPLDSTQKSILSKDIKLTGETIPFATFEDDNELWPDYTIIQDPSSNDPVWIGKDYSIGTVFKTFVNNVANTKINGQYILGTKWDNDVENGDLILTPKDIKIDAGSINYKYRSTTHQTNVKDILDKLLYYEINGNRFFTFDDPNPKKYFDAKDITIDASEIPVNKEVENGPTVKAVLDSLSTATHFKGVITTGTLPDLTDPNSPYINGDVIIMQSTEEIKDDQGNVIERYTRDVEYICYDGETKYWIELGDATDERKSINEIISWIGTKTMNATDLSRVLENEPFEGLPTEVAWVNYNFD